MSRGMPADADLAARRRQIDSLADRAPLAPAVRVTEETLGGVPVVRCVPEASGAAVLLWFHGGAYRVGSARGFRSWTSHLAAACSVEVVSVDYGIAPEHPFPDGLIDALLAYAALAGEGRPVLVGGESAGGGLAAALLLATADRGLARPVGAVLLSPWLDLRVEAPSFTANAASDALFSAESARAAAALYLQGHRASDPLVSPVLGDWAGQPPVLVQVSDAEVLLDDARTLAAVAPSVRLEVYAGLPHTWHLGFPHAEGSRAAVESVDRFLRAFTS